MASRSIFPFSAAYIHNAKCTLKGHCAKGTGTAQFWDSHSLGCFLLTQTNIQELALWSVKARKGSSKWSIVANVLQSFLQTQVMQYFVPELKYQFPIRLEKNSVQLLCYLWIWLFSNRSTYLQPRYLLLWWRICVLSVSFQQRKFKLLKKSHYSDGKKIVENNQTGAVSLKVWFLIDLELKFSHLYFSL